jgi:hypothetical protein
MLSRFTPRVPLRRNREGSRSSIAANGRASAGKESKKEKDRRALCTSMIQIFKKRKGIAPVKFKIHKSKMKRL